MSVHDFAIKHGTVVTAAGRAAVNVYADSGRITHVTGEDLRARHEVNADGLYVLPGMVDTHVHLMDPGDSEREDFLTGTSAAAIAGVTTIIEHTHGHPIRDIAEFDEKRSYLHNRSYVDFGLAAHVWPDRIGTVGELWDAGITFFKIFTCTTHGVPALDAWHLLRAFDALAAVGASTLIHAEDESITMESERMLRSLGRQDGGVIPEWRSREAELVAASVVAVAAEVTGAHATIAHVSMPAVVDVIAQARGRGADLVGEACPQYFLLREFDVHEHGPFRKFTPPARCRNDAEEDEMWRLLRSGALAHVSTDHAPSTPEQKRTGSIWECHFGLPGLDTTSPLLLDAASQGKLSLEDVVRVYSSAPARRYGLAPEKGRIAPGADADLILLDPEPQRLLRDDDVRSRAGWTPYAGRTVRGRIVATYLRGHPLAENGELVSDFAGEFLPGPGATGGSTTRTNR